jgi:hypothetical protein
MQDEGLPIFIAMIISAVIVGVLVFAAAIIGAVLLMPT